MNISCPVVCLAIFLLLSTNLNLVAAAADHNSIPSNITMGSSLSASPNSITSHLLSPSGTFAFGFKPLDNQYKVCIWIANSSDKTIVWVPDRDHDESVDGGSSILLNHDGVFVLQKPGNQSLPLLNNSTAPTQPAFSALMLDTGNLAIYNNRSEIIWQSFDYPTDTILAGQTLKPGHHLISTSSEYNITMKESGELVLSRRHYGTKYDYHYVPPSYGYGYQTYGYGYTPGVGYGYGYHPRYRYGYQPGHGYNTEETDKSVYEWDVSWTSKTQNKGNHVVLNLDTTGRLSLVDQDHKVIKNFTQGEKNVGSTIYRATLGRDGVFRLYGDRIGSQAGKLVELWRAPGAKHSHSHALATILGIVFGSIFLLVLVIVVVLFCRYGPRN